MQTKQNDAPESPSLKSIVDELPLDRLKDEAREGAQAVSQWAIQSASQWITDAASRLEDVSSGPMGGMASGAVKGAVEEGSPAKGAVKGGLQGAWSGIKEKLTGGASSGGTASGGSATKSTHITEEIDIGAPIDVVYGQWTQLQDFSGFMKKVENVEQESDEKVNFKAQVFWSHRTWNATIIEQVPDELIIWRSTGEKGHVDGAVTFHELAPRLTRVIVVLEYYPQGLFERTGNIWRAQGRRARLELKHFRRHVMMTVLPDPDQAEGWRGEIHDSEVVADHGEAEPEEEADDEAEDESEAEPEEEPEDELEEEEPEDELEEEEPEDEPEEEEPEDEPEDEADDAENEEEEQPRRRSRSNR